MKFLKLFIGAVLLAALSNSALAELKLIKREVVPFGDGGYIKLVSEEGRHFWVVPDAEDDKKTGKKIFFLQIEDFFDGRSSRRVVLDKRLPPAFLPLGQQHGLLAVANAMAEWNAIKLNKESSRVDRYGELKSMLAVTETAIVGDKYIVGGVSKDNVPILVKMGDGLKIERELKLQSKGRVNSIFALAGKAFAVSDFEDRLSEVLKLSPDLSVVEKIKLAGALATGIPLRDGGFAVTYTSLPDMVVFVERFNSSAQSLWRKKIFTRSGISTDVYVLCELQDGLGLVGGNNNRLLVARIDANGTRIRLTEDTRTGLGVPVGADKYLVGVLDNKIHVRGMAMNPNDTSYTSFHFVETSAP
ncbi:MAG: hypothetical protein ACYCZQ_05690 [Burkholderiales bacterium]